MGCGSKMSFIMYSLRCLFCSVTTMSFRGLLFSEGVQSTAHLALTVCPKAVAEA